VNSTATTVTVNAPPPTFSPATIISIVTLTVAVTFGTIGLAYKKSRRANSASKQTRKQVYEPKNNYLGTNQRATAKNGDLGFSSYQQKVNCEYPREQQVGNDAYAQQQVAESCYDQCIQ